MPGNNTRNGKKGSGKGKVGGGKSWKKVDSLTAAYIRVIRTSKQIKKLKSSMAPVVMREIFNGLDEGNKIYKEHIPSLFLGQLEPTYRSEKRKNEKVFKSPKINNLTYDIDYLSIKNEKDRDTGLYFPDMTGRKFPLSLKNNQAEKLYVGDTRIKLNNKTEITPTSIQHILGAEINDEHSHKSLSIILKTKHLEKAINIFTNKIELPTIRDDNLIKLRTEIIKTIMEVEKTNNGFRDETESFDVIPTSDYIIHVCGTKHSINKTKFAVEIRKRLVVATIRNSNTTESNKDMHLPLIEEISIQLKFPDTSNIKGMPLLANHDECFVISCTLGHHNAEKTCDAVLHYFGDNAFSVEYEIDKSKIIQDKTKLCLNLAGNLIKKIIDINSTDYRNIISSVQFFKDMFKLKKYKDFDSIEGPKTAKAIFHLSAEMFDKPRVEKIFNAFNIPKIEEGQPDPDGDEIKSVLHSFLKRQNIRGLLEVNAGIGCNIEKWISSPTFSVLSLSSFKTPHRKYVFILTYSGRGRLEIKDEFRPMTSQYTSLNSNKASVHITEKKPIQAREISGRSLLSPDLEKELDILFA